MTKTMKALRQGAKALLLLLGAALLAPHAQARVVNSLKASQTQDQFCVGGTGVYKNLELCIDASADFIPTTDNTGALGIAGNGFASMYVDGNATILGNLTLSGILTSTNTGSFTQVAIGTTVVSSAQTGLTLLAPAALTPTGYAVVVSSTNGTAQFVIEGNGRVGIGTTAPNQALEVGSSGNLDVSGGSVAIGTTAPGTNQALTVQALAAQTPTQFTAFVSSTNGNVELGVQGNGAIELAPGATVYANNGSVSLSTAATQGTAPSIFLAPAASLSVGLGTVTPKSAVDIAGSLSLGSFGGVNAAPANGLIVSGGVGIGTSAPLGTNTMLTVQAPAAGTPTQFILQASSTNATNVFGVTNAGHLQVDGSAPSPSANCAMATGSTDMAGSVVISGGATSTCTLTFSLAYTNKPFCVAADETVTTSTVQTAPATNQVVLTLSSARNDTLDYICLSR